MQKLLFALQALKLVLCLVPVNDVHQKICNPVCKNSTLTVFAGFLGELWGNPWLTLVNLGMVVKVCVCVIAISNRQ